MTPGQFENCVKGYQERIQDHVQLTDSLNHTLGQYIGYSVNNPKKYPKTPLLQKKKEKKWLDEDELIARAKAMTKRLGGIIND